HSITDPTEAYSNWVFRMSVPISLDLPARLGSMASDGHKRLAVVWEEDAYGQQASELAVELAKEHDMNVVASVSAPKSATDLTAPATKLRNSKPDAIFLATASTGSAGALLRKLREVGLKVPVYGLAGIVQKQIISNAGTAAESLIAPALVNPDAPGP